MAQTGALDVDGTKVPVTNLDKQLYPGAQFTKAQVIDYYIRVSKYLLPHLKNRPVTLKRYPDGVGAEHFYEKDAPSYRPSWVQTFPVPRRNGGPDIQYILINDLRTLVWCANLANLEIHPFLHRAPLIDQPDCVVFDLDPGEGADIVSCSEVALLLRDALLDAKLKSFPKVSGSKGIQLYVPLNAPVTYDTARAFAKRVAELLAQAQPGKITAEMPKHLRKRKVFIDWSQNSDFKTTVGVYSLRAKRSDPFVSMPVTWRELEQAVETGETVGLYFQPDAALARLEDMGDLYDPVLKLKQRLPGMAENPKRPSPKALKEYRSKRDSSSTAEPTAEEVPRRSKQGSRRRFVVQKHAAKHLHYDFRLEMHNALKSWAVPKGVPFSLEERRLAAATEDHPLEYLDFEGTIPVGQYGGGTVMVWDIGTYELIEGNYYKGRLHFHLNGKKLRGEWLLTRDPGDGKNWRLTKAGEPLKPLPRGKEDESVLTGRSMQQIAEAGDAQWQSNRTRAGIDLEALPLADVRFIEPMQALAVERLPDAQGWSYEVFLLI